MRVKDTKTFIKKAKSVHGSTYDYSLVEYVNNKTKVEIVCAKHGIFFQDPSNHFAGKGCRVCAKNSRADSNRSSKDKFIKKAIKVHGKKYDYSLVDYVNARTKVEIICDIHGSFMQIPDKHINSKQGCKECGNNRGFELQRKGLDNFITEAKKVHGDKYDYSFVEYKGAHEKIEIVCSDHGVFTQTANSHLVGSGCPLCGKYGFQNNLPAILYYLKVEDFEGNVAYKIGITNRTVAQRYRALDMTKITVLSELEFKVGMNAYKEEQKILKEFADQKWDGEDLLKNGNTELFKTDVLGLDK